MHRLLRLSACYFVTLGAPSAAFASSPKPRLDGRAPISCATDPSGVPVRLQCDTPATGAGVCWVAPACRQGFEGVGEQTCDTLERVRYCDWSNDKQTFEALTAGHALVAAKADVEQGWYRDDEGRVFQVEFDLNQRFWLGGGWVGTWREDGSKELGGGVLEMGLRADILSSDLTNKTRVRMLETSLTLAPFGLHASFLKLDTSNDGNEPIMSITTFVGEPARHDVYLTAGWWAELLTVDLQPRGSDDDNFLRIAGAGITWDLWHDADMTSYLRVRGGGSIDEILPTHGDGLVAFVPQAYVEGDFTLDDAGFHHLTLSSGYEAVYLDPPGDVGVQGKKRFLNELAYELVLIAINDQPLTLRAAVAGGYRDDLTDPALNGWEISATAGLRFSLWAPARDLDARARAAQRMKERGQ